jgi:hypothetical protein
MDGSTPTFSQPYIDVYFSRPYIEQIQTRLRASRKFAEITFTSKPQEKEVLDVPFAISAGMARSAFSLVLPAPFQARFRYGVDNTECDGDLVLSAHPDCDLWLQAPAGATQIKWDFGFFPGAYERDGDRTDGVEFLITGETPDGHQRQIYRRVLDPVRTPADRGRQHEVIPYRSLPGETLKFSDRPNLNSAYDWAYWARIEVK